MLTRPWIFSAGSPDPCAPVGAAAAAQLRCGGPNIHLLEIDVQTAGGAGGHVCNWGCGEVVNWVPSQKTVVLSIQSEWRAVCDPRLTAVDLRRPSGRNPVLLRKRDTGTS